MVLIGNQPIVWHIMKSYAHFGFNEFILALGYKANYIKDFFLNQKAFTSDFTITTKTHKTEYHLKRNKDSDNFKITFVDKGLESLPGERIYRTHKYIPKEDKYFMVTYGDGVTDLNVKKLFKFHKSQKRPVTITGVHPRSKYGHVKIGTENAVKGFKEKPVLSDWVNGGFMIFNRSILNRFKNTPSEIELLNIMASEGKVSVYKHEGFWFAVDTHKELEDLNAIWNNGNPPWRVWE